MLSRVRSLWFRCRNLFGKEGFEQDLDEELRFHLEMETEKYVREGMSPEKARHLAMRTFGGLTQHKEAVRDVHRLAWLEDLARDLRFAVRRLVRERGYSVPTVATLALGIGVTAAVFALVYGVLIRPLPFPDADRLVAVKHAASGVQLAESGLSTGTFLHYREHNRVFEDIALYGEKIYTVTDPGAPEQIDMVLASPSLLSVLSATPYLGRLPTVDRELGGPAEVLISHDLWVRRYGADPGIVGRTITIEGRRDIVVGVAEPGFHFPDPETQVWIGWSQEALFDAYGPHAGLSDLSWGGIARLREGVSLQEATRDVQRLIAILPDAYAEVTAEELDEMGLRAVVLPFRDVMVGDVRVLLLMLLATAGFLMLITWANATNLSLVRAEHQRREVAVTRALGASGGHLARRFLSESVLLAGVGGTLGLALAYIAVEARFGFQPDQIPRLHDVGVNGVVIGLTLALTVATCVLLGTVSLLGAGRPMAPGALTGTIGRMTASRREQTGRRLLVAGQVALALTLLIGSALMAQSFWRLTQVELGFEPEDALTFHLPVPSNVYSNYHASARIHQEVLARLRALPGVEAAEAANHSGFPLTPVPEYYNKRLAVADRAAADLESWPYALFGFATPGYFQAMGIPILQGRTFRRVDTSREAPGVVLSESLARALFGGEDPVGQRVRWPENPEFPAYTVVGVAGDVPSLTIRDGPSRAIYFPNLYPPQADTITGVVHIYIPSDEVYVLRTRVPPTSLVPAIRRAVQEVDPDLVMARIGTLEELVADSAARARLTMLLLLVGAGTALCLGVIGIYGVLSYTVSQRTSELGIRLALGADPGDVVRMVVRQGAVLALAGIAAGLLTAYILTRYLESVLYEVSPTDPAAFAAMATLLLAVALVASYVPAHRAGRIDPARTLRAE